MASKGAALVWLSVATAAAAVVAVAATYGLSNRSDSKSAKDKPTSTKTTPKSTSAKPPPLVPAAYSLEVSGTLAKESSSGDTQVSESFELTKVRAVKKSGAQGTYVGSAEGTFNGTSRQRTFNSTAKYTGKIVKGSVTFSLTDNGYGTLSGTGSLALPCKITSGTASNKYGTKPMTRSTTTVVIAIAVTVEGSAASVRAKGGSGTLEGRFGPSKL